MIELRFVVMRINTQSNLDFLQLGRVVMFARLAIPLLLLVLVLAEINDPTNGRRRVRRHFDQIVPALKGCRQRLAGRHHPELFSVSTYYPHFACANLLVNTNKLLNE